MSYIIHGDRIILNKEGFHFLIIRQCKDVSVGEVYYEMRTYIDNYGTEYWKRVPFSLESIEKQIEEYGE